MPARLLADFLPDFGAPQAPGPALVRMEQTPPPPPAEPVPDIAAIVAEAVSAAEARREGEMRAVFEAEMAAERDRHQSEVAALRAALGSDAGAVIAARLGEAEVRLTALATDATARILSSVLSDDLARRSVDQLARTIRQALADREVVRVKITGPLSLFEGLRDSLGPLAERCDYVEAPGFDITVTIDDTVFETRLAEWSTTIGGALS